MVAIAGNRRDAYEKRHCDAAMRTVILSYYGVAAGRIEILQGVLEEPAAAMEVLATAARLGSNWE
jgi:hypothetical protein